MNKINDNISEVERNNYESATSANTISTNGFTVDDIGYLVKKLDLNLTPEERTLKATDGKYDTIIVPNVEFEHKFRAEFGNLNFVINPIVKDKVMLIKSKYMAMPKNVGRKYYKELLGDWNKLFTGEDK